MTTMASQNTSLTGLCEGNSPGPVNFPHKGPVTRKMLPFDDVIMKYTISHTLCRALLCVSLVSWHQAWGHSWSMFSRRMTQSQWNDIPSSCWVVIWNAQIVKVFHMCVLEVWGIPYLVCDGPSFDCMKYCKQRSKLCNILARFPLTIINRRTPSDK